MPAAACRRGSILLFCLAMVATLAVLAYGFVRVVQLHREVGANDNVRLLARQAALTGANHAIEQLLRDFANERFTRLDSPGTRQFAPHDFPYTSTNNTDKTDINSTTGGAPKINVNDMPGADCFDAILWGNSGGSLAYSSGQMNETGRGRFYEPEFYNLPTAASYNTAATPAPYSAAATDPTVAAGRPAVKFGDPYPGALDRSDGMFYDGNFCRVQEPDPRLARDKARYRLRYAVNTLDLDGMILVNGDQAVHPGKVKTVDPAAVAVDVGVPGASLPTVRVADVEAVRRVVRNMHRLPAVVDAVEGWGATGVYNRFISGGETSGGAAEHVFTGRGSTSNVDQRAGNGYAPTTFPYMYRQPDDFSCFGPGATAVTEGAWPGANLYAHAAPNAVTGDAKGGEIIPPGGANHATFIRMLMGPQYSFFDFLHATYGSEAEGVDSRGMAPLGKFTPFGRGVSQRAAAEPLSRYRSNVDTPWCVDLLTATPRVVYGMVSGYMPPGAIVAAYPIPGTPVTYTYAQVRTRDLFVKQLSPAFRYDAPQRVPAAPNGRIQPDYHVDDFWRLAGASPTVYRGPDDRYPGRLAYNGWDPSATHSVGAMDMSGKWQHDNLGVFLRTQKAAPTAYDATGRYKTTTPRASGAGEPGTHAVGGFWNSVGATHKFVAPTLGQYLNTQCTCPNGQYFNLGCHPDSVWEAIGQAMGAAASTLQGQYFQYLNQVTSPAPDKWFNGGPWVGPKAATLRDVDELFVRNLGSNFAVPNDPTPVPVWYSASTYLKSFTPGWNLAALNDQNPKCLVLATNPALVPTPAPGLPVYALNHALEPGYDATQPSYSATERTQLVELLVNDFRMSFFGSSPQYPDFKVLDLNGDGKAACSCYPANGTATGREHDLGIDQYTLDVDGAGVALAPVAADVRNTFFSNTGCFVLGKGRFWRILVRGEVWDNLLNVTVDRVQLETVLCIDPAEQAAEMSATPGDPAAGMYSTHIISQGWVFDGQREYLPKRY